MGFTDRGATAALRLRRRRSPPGSGVHEQGDRGEGRQDAHEKAAERENVLREQEKSISAREHKIATLERDMAKEASHRAKEEVLEEHEAEMVAKQDRLRQDAGRLQRELGDRGSGEVIHAPPTPMPASSTWPPASRLWARRRLSRLRPRRTSPSISTRRTPQGARARAGGARSRPREHGDDDRLPAAAPRPQEEAPR